MKTLNKKEKEPLYLALYERLREDILNGVYQYGSKLPSKRLLSEELNISLITVQHTYDLLSEEGYIDPRERSGYYCNYKPDGSFYSSSVGNTSFNIIQHPKGNFPFSAFAKSMRKTLSDYAEAVFVKCEGSGCGELKSALVRYLARSRGIKATEKQIVIGAGAEYLYGLLIQMLGRDKTYAAEQPSYEKIEQVYRANGVKYEMLPLGNDGIQSRALNKTQASVLHITPYRSFPSGVTADASKKLEYMRWVQKKDRYIIEDDFESEFTLSAKPAETLFGSSNVYGKEACERILYVNTFSKTLSPAIRMAYMLLPEPLIPLFEKTVGFYSCTVPTFEQYAVAQFIESGEFERHINRVRRKDRKALKNSEQI